MVLTAIALLLSIVGVAVFPCWRHSARWGYAPSMVAGLLLVLVSLLSIGGMSKTSDAYAFRIVAGPQLAQAQP
jgi:hypothetical protein